MDKKVSVLSGGERARLSLAKLLLEPANLLVLDEPTNHLDMRSKDILKQALMNFDGTVILVSHDRDFLDGVVQTVYEFKNKKAKQHLGGIAEFLEKKKLETLNQLNIQKRVVADEKPKELSESKIKYEERKEVEKRIRKAQKTVEESEERIMKLETDLELMDQMLSRPENLSDPKVFEKYDSLKKELEKEMHLWEQAHQEWEELKRIKTY
ncbi:MAG TPA: hypothetical protein DEQ03_13630 [Marinilabiliales bacterium]|nr:hypothetical protein [Marinilabiliales bacterium]